MNELEQFKRVLSAVSELRSKLEGLVSSPASQLDIVPDKVRAYLHHLETTTDPTEDPAILESARETIEALTKLNMELRKSLNVRMGPEA